MLGDYVKLSIRDEGCGIPNEDLQKIFDPYFTTKEGGNGLGLATCYSIIKNHGGYISVNSKVGKGSTFSIFLPASKACALEDVVSFEGLKQGSGRILVMDDEPSIRKVLSDLLLGIGYNVECASNGCEAIEMYKAAKASDKPFDVAIMDLTIPGGMGGADAIKKLHEYDPEVKAIVCSGYCDDQIIANPNSYGFKAGIVKPVNFEELSKLVEGLIKK
jgi:CheY-like chemotaxis protein